MSGSTTYTLKYPLEINGTKVAVLNVRRPKARDLDAMERAGSSGTARTMRLLVNLCELPPATVEELDGEDLMALDELVTGMLGKGQSRP